MKTKINMFALVLTGILLFSITGKHSALKAAPSEENIEALTYRLFIEQKWDSLLFVGEQTIANGTDYFYLRLRVGRAAFELQKYARSARHLEASHKYNAFDTDANLLLLSAYRLSGQNYAANTLLASLPEGFRKSYPHYMDKTIVYVETGPVLSNHQDKYYEARSEYADIYSEAYLHQNSYYFLAGVQQSPGYRISINTAISFLDLNKQRIVTTGMSDSLTSDYKVSQWELYVAPGLLLWKRFAVSPAFRWISVNMDNPQVNYDPKSMKYSGPMRRLIYHDYVAGGEISYVASWWSASGGAWHSRISETNFDQVSIGVGLRPLGNLNFYTSSIISWKSSTFEDNLIYYQMVGGKLNSHLWGEASILQGNLTGYVETNGQVVFNLLDKINTRVTARIIYPLNENIKLSLRYQMYFCEGTEYMVDNDLKDEILRYKYNNHSITGGILWNLK